jgi:hypothetical protein
MAFVFLFSRYCHETWVYCFHSIVALNVAYINYIKQNFRIIIIEYGSTSKAASNSRDLPGINVITRLTSR